MGHALRMSEADFTKLQQRRQQPVKVEQSVAEKKRLKYGNEKTTVDGRKFDSKREAQRWKDLRLRYEAGEISDPACQVAFMLPGRIRYVADFVYLERSWDTGKPPALVVEDVKGVRTREYVMKKKLMRERWNISITET